MGLYDRDYTHDQYRGGGYYAPQMRMNMPRITPVVKWLLIVNIGVYILCITPLGNLIYALGSVNTRSWMDMIQIWRLVTYQFLHDPGNPMHLFMNMLGVYFLGPTLERHWGSQRFLRFYLTCGVAGALLYCGLTMVHFLHPGYMVGASGAILGMLAACAILFPQFVVFVILFPVPIRIAAVGFAFLYFLLVATRSTNAGGEAAHLGGMAAGAIYVWYLQGHLDTWLGRFKNRHKETVVRFERDMHAEVDQILRKVKEQGLQSLSWKEKRILRKATEQEQKRGM